MSDADNSSCCIFHLPKCRHVAKQSVYPPKLIGSHLNDLPSGESGSFLAGITLPDVQQQLAVVLHPLNHLGDVFLLLLTLKGSTGNIKERDVNGSTFV